MGFSLLGNASSKSNSNTSNVDSSGSGNSDSSGEGSYNFSNANNSVFNVTNSDAEAIKAAADLATEGMAYNSKDFKGLVNLGYDSLKLGAGLSEDGMSYNSKNFGNVLDFASKSMGKLLDAKENDLNAVSDATFKSVDKNNAAIFDSLDKNLDFASSTGNSIFKALDKNLSFAGDVVYGNSKYAKDMTEFYLNQNAKESAANRNLMQDANQSVVSAWQGATKSTMALSTDYMDMLTSNQNTALEAIMKSSQGAQDTTLKAMNGIFESSKGSTERVIDNSLKYIVFGVIGLFAIPFLSRTFAK